MTSDVEVLLQDLREVSVISGNTGTETSDPGFSSSYTIKTGFPPKRGPTQYNPSKSNRYTFPTTMFIHPRLITLVGTDASKFVDSEVSILT